ncbi:hypothetical protein PPACK8108_LOCUS16049 [Phakopsora pachyrhizi]|uniref:Uncharacterized protein n=1 Tax=Phakopsora pachyrhizi TaxID=170000 RepID=A0AAV0BAD6_PHAPC|nr:hypothetical protein PPACK8108_LOCUS16049 [Phakopsora pachyrhizi]
MERQGGTVETEQLKKSIHNIADGAKQLSGRRCCYSAPCHMGFEGTLTSVKDLIEISNATSEGKEEALRPRQKKVTFSDSGQSRLIIGSRGGLLLDLWIALSDFA